MFNLVRLFPTSFYLFLRKSFRDVLGVTCIVTSVILFVSLYSYHNLDVSFNTSTAGISNNIFGAYGSYSVDLLLQLFGVNSYVLIFVLMIWGGQFLINDEFKFTALKNIYVLLGIIIFGVFLSGLSYYPFFQYVFHSLLKSMPCYEGAFSYILFQKINYFLYTYHLGFVKLPFLIMSLISAFFLLWKGIGLTYGQLKSSTSTFLLIITIISKYVKKIASLLVSFSKKKNADLSTFGESIPTLSKGISLTPKVIFEEMTSISKEENEYDVEHDFHSFERGDDPTQSTDDHNTTVSNLSSKGQKSKRHTFKDQYIDSEDYQLPSTEILDKTEQKIQTISQDLLQEQSLLLITVLEEFGVKGEIVNVRPGPVVTMYELKPAPGIKTSRVIGLSDDIARSMSALCVRIAVIPGQNVIGIELPNKNRQTVYLRSMLVSKEYHDSKAALPLVLGQDIGGRPIITDLAKMPHLLVAGTTGSGKSVSVNAMILSLLFKLTPEQCKFIMIDPKMLELSVYDDIPHLLTPVVTDPKKAVVALKWAVKEMESRYRDMAKLGVRNIDGFNTRLKEAKQTGEVLVRRVQTGFDPETGKPIFEDQDLNFEPLPYIVVVVDEMADLMLVAGKDIEAAIQRLAQMARAAGIHLIMATQRPSVDVITGTIKANFPTRISFQVTSKIDSRTILGEQGAEQLLGQGDMLYMAGGGRIMRVHGPFVRDEEVERVVRFLKVQGEPQYIDGVTDDQDEPFSPTPDENKGGDDIYQQAVDLILREGKVSTSFIQRHLQIGYNRAARIVEQMEKEGVISAANHVGKREILRNI